MPVSPRAPSAANSLVEEGNALYAQGDVAGAIRCYQAAVAADPGCGRGHFNLGVVLQASGQLDEALSHYARVPADGPEFAKALLNWGNALKDKGDWGGAAEQYSRALECGAQRNDVLRNLARLGDLARASRDSESARRIYGFAASLGSADGHTGLGVLHVEEGKLLAARERFTQALALDPRHWVAHHECGKVLVRLHRLEEALEHFRDAVTIDPANTQVLLSLADALRRRGELGAAIEVLERVLRTDPGDVQAINNLGNALLEAGDLDTAERLLAGIALDPLHEEPRYNLGIIALFRHNFREGWEGYERRFRVMPGALPAPLPGLPRFEVAAAASTRCVGVLKEQGLGDQILYSTLLPDLGRLVGTVVVETDRRLLDAYSRSLPGMRFLGPEEFRDAARRCDAQVALGSLPSLFRSSIASFARQPCPLLHPDKRRAEQIDSGTPVRKRIGISWRSFQSGTREFVRRRKSIPLECFGRLAGHDVCLVDLQYGDVQDERAGFDSKYPNLRHQVEGLDLFNDLEGVLAAISCCDLVVTTSNVTAHLAGAIGKKTWLLLLGANPLFHYWVPGPDGRALWYPSVEIMTHRSWDAWEQALEAVAKRLERGEA